MSDSDLESCAKTLREAVKELHACEARTQLTRKELTIAEKALARAESKEDDAIEAVKQARYALLRAAVPLESDME